MLYAITDRRRYAEDGTLARQRLLELAEVWASNGVTSSSCGRKICRPRSSRVAPTMLGIIPRSPVAPPAFSSMAVPISLSPRAPMVSTYPPGPMRSRPTRYGLCSLLLAASKRQSSASRVTRWRTSKSRGARGVDCILFAPVFEKRIVPEPGKAADKPAHPGTGPELLAQACHLAAPIPIFALGGVTAQNAAQCLQAGAAGVAAIRLLQQPPSAWLSLV